MFRIAIIATCCTVISSPCGLHAVEDEVAAKARAEAEIKAAEQTAETVRKSGDQAAKDLEQKAKEAREQK